MALAKLDDAKVNRIRSAAPSVTNAELAEELGVSERTVIRYRKTARQEREEIAREVVARHVEETIPDALADLTALRGMAKDAYQASGDSRDGKLWLDAIKTTLDHVKPDDSALDDAIEAELARVADAGQGAALAAAQGAGAGGLRLG